MREIERDRERLRERERETERERERERETDATQRERERQREAHIGRQRETHLFCSGGEGIRSRAHSCSKPICTCVHVCSRMCDCMCAVLLLCAPCMCCVAVCVPHWYMGGRDTQRDHVKHPRVCCFKSKRRTSERHRESERERERVRERGRDIDPYPQRYILEIDSTAQQQPRVKGAFAMTAMTRHDTP